MKKIDYKKDFKELYLPPQKPVIINVPKMNFLMVSGTGGNPSKNKEFQDALQALYTVAFTVKFTLKFAKVGPEYTVPPLEALWYTTDGKPFDMKNQKNWAWTTMITQPTHITKKHIVNSFKTIRERAAKKKQKVSPKLKEIKLKPFTEGKCVQIMHIGPYSKEGENIKLIHEFAKSQGYKLYGKHHEIYLGDPRRTKPAKLRTVLRQPIKE